MTHDEYELLLEDQHARRVRQRVVRAQSGDPDDDFDDDASDLWPDDHTET